MILDEEVNGKSALRILAEVSNDVSTCKRCSDEFDVIAKLLLKHGADPNDSRNENDTLLLNLCKYRYTNYDFIVPKPWHFECLRLPANHHVHGLQYPLAWSINAPSYFALIWRFRHAFTHLRSCNERSRTRTCLKQKSEA